jgi:hypothetical protein
VNGWRGGEGGMNWLVAGRGDNKEFQSLAS